MAILGIPRLTLKRDAQRKTVKVTIGVSIFCSRLEMAMFQVTPGERWFRIKAKLRGQDEWPNQDNTLYTMPQSFYLPNQAYLIGANEFVLSFQDTVGEDILDEDGAGRDEIYARVSKLSYLTQQSNGLNSDVVTLSL